MREHLATYPRDLAVVQRFYFVWFWQGRFPEMLELTGRPRPPLSGELLHARPARLRPGGGASHPGGLRHRGGRGGAQCPRRVGDPRPGPRRVRDGRGPGRPRAPAAGHSPLHAPRLVPQPPGLAPRPHALRVRRLRAGQPDVARRFRAPALVDSGQPSRFHLAPAGGSSWSVRTWASDGGPSRPSLSERLDRQALLFHAAHLAMALAAAGEWATAERQLGMLAGASGEGPDRSGRRRARPARRGASRLRRRGLPPSGRAHRARAPAHRGPGRQPRPAGCLSRHVCSRRASARATPRGPSACWPSAWRGGPMPAGWRARPGPGPWRRRRSGGPSETPENHGSPGLWPRRPAGAAGGRAGRDRARSGGAERYGERSMIGPPRAHVAREKG